MRSQPRGTTVCRWLSLSIAWISVGACVTIPQHNFQAPPPAVAPVPPVQSSATVRVEGIATTPIGPKLIAAVPRAIDAPRFPGGCGNPCYHFGLETFDAVLTNGRMVMSPTYRGKVQAKVNFGECDLDPVIVNVSLSARPVIIRKNNQWALSLADARVQATIGPGSDTHCVIGGLLDASSTLQSKLDEVAGGMKSQVEAITFPVPIDDLENKLLGPIPIPSSGGRTFCVYTNVTDLQIGTIEAWQPPFETAVLFIPLPQPIKTSLPKFIAVPLAFLGAPSMVATKSACPAPQPVPGPIKLVDGATQLPFQLMATLAADYAALSDVATGTLKPTEGHWGPFKLTVKPTRLQLGNSNGQVIAALSVTGSVKGTVYFWGTPTVSDDGKTVSIPNLTLAATSQTALSSKDARLPDFFANLFKKPIQDAFTVNLSQLLPQTSGTQPISVPLADNALLQLGSLNVSVVSLKSVDGELQANVLVKGNANARTP